MAHCSWGKQHSWETFVQTASALEIHYTTVIEIHYTTTIVAVDVSLGVDNNPKLVIREITDPQ